MQVIEAKPVPIICQNCRHWIPSGARHEAASGQCAGPHRRTSKNWGIHENGPTKATTLPIVNFDTTCAHYKK